MLNWINQRKQNIAGGSLAVFAAGWLLLLGQACMAQPMANDACKHHATRSIDPAQQPPCHDATTGNETRTTAPDSHQLENHCAGLCDCNSIDVSLNSSEQQSKPDKPSHDFNAAIITEFDADHQSALAVTGPVIRQPDRAVVLPYQRFIVLLI